MDLQIPCAVATLLLIPIDLDYFTLSGFGNGLSSSALEKFDTWVEKVERTEHTGYINLLHRSICSSYLVNQFQILVTIVSVTSWRSYVHSSFHTFLLVTGLQ